MATVRPTPSSYYYSGQGRLGIGTRNNTGTVKDLVFVGNVTSLTIDIATTKFDHKESMTGLRGIDLTIVQERNATFAFTSESLTLDLLSTGLYGVNASAAGAAVTDEAHTATKGKAVPLRHPNVSAVTVAQGVTPMVEGVDYAVDYGFGTIYILATSTVITSPDMAILVDYTYAAYDTIEAFTTGTPPERFLRFEGLNTVNGDLRLIDVYRAAFDPLTGLEFINEELGAGEFAGTLLPAADIVAPTESKYFKERRVYATP